MVTGSGGRSKQVCGIPGSVFRTCAIKAWVSLQNRFFLQAPEKRCQLPESEGFACHCKICKRVRPAAVSGCFLLLYKVVKDEYVTDFSLHGGNRSGHRTGNSLIGDSPEVS